MTAMVTPSLLLQFEEFRENKFYFSFFKTSKTKIND